MTEKEYKREYYLKNRDLIIEKSRLWREQNYEKSLGYAKKSYYKNRESNLKRRKEQRDAEDPVLLSEKRKKWYRNNPEPKLKAGKIWRDNHREYMAAKQREWSARNKDTRAATQAKRRAAKMQRTPPWLTEQDKLEIKGFYTEAKRLTEDTGIKHVVDHIVPLQGELVSGLHVPNNLQVLTETDNSKKHNDFIPCFHPLTDL